MMTNRRKESAAMRFGPSLKALFICAFIGSAAVGYVWHVKQLHLLGRKIVEGEKYVEKIRRENKEMEKRLHHLKSPAVLRTLIAKHQLEMDMTDPDQVIVIDESTGREVRRSQPMLIAVK